MTGETSRRHAALDKRVFRLTCFGMVGIIVYLIVNLVI
jgi:hypothetical protein